MEESTYSAYYPVARFVSMSSGEARFAAIRASARENKKRKTVWGTAPGAQENRWEINAMSRLAASKLEPEEINEQVDSWTVSSIMINKQVDQWSSWFNNEQVDDSYEPEEGKKSIRGRQWGNSTSSTSVHK